MARILKLRFNGNAEHFDLYYYGGTTGANSTTAIKVDNSVNTDLDFDLEGKILSTGTTSRAEMYIELRPRVGCSFPLTNLLTEPTWGHYFEGRSNSSVPGGIVFRVTPVLKWADGGGESRYTQTVPSTGPAPSKPDAFINLRFEGNTAHFQASYSGALAPSTVNLAANTDLNINLKDLVNNEGNTARELNFRVAPKAGYLVTKVESVPVGEMNAYLGKVAWTWNAASGVWTSPAVNTMASDTLYRMVVTSEAEPVPVSTIKIQFAGNKDHFTVGYKGGLVGSTPIPVSTTGVFELDLEGKVLKTGNSQSRYLDFEIFPTAGATVISASTSPLAPVNPFLGRRDWQWGKGSLPQLQCSISYETASETLYTITVVTSGPTPDVESPFNKLFNLSRSKMEELSDKMLGVWGDGAGSPASSGFLINLLLLPFKLPTEVLGDEQSIKIGSYGTGVRAPIITDDSIDVDLGTITVADLFGSSLDYAAAQYELVLPFFGNSVELAPSQVVGRVINARYNLDAYSGTATVNVFNDDSGVPIASATDKVARAIPFKMFSEVENKLDEPVQTNNGVMQAFIRVTRQEVVLGAYDSLVQINGQLGSSLGYMEVENVELQGVPDSDKVKALLRNGVVIK